MAKQREYAYQIKGNKLSIIEKDFSTTDGLNYVYSGTAGDGITDDIPSGSQLFKSPLDTITNGIEIEYSYSPEWSVNSDSAWGDDLFVMNGWTVIDGYLTFLRGEASNTQATTRPDWNSILTVGDHVLIKNSDRWNGVHKVQEAQAKISTTHAGIKTYTKVNKSAGYVTEVGTQDTNEQISLITALTRENVLSWEYVWIAGADTVTSVGLFSGHGNDGGTSTRIYFDGTNGSSNPLAYGVDEATDTSENIDAPSWGSTASVNLYFYEAFRDPGMRMYTSVDVLNDEDDTIDLPPYLSRALVYYVKAKAAEDTMQIDVKEYLMKEFRKMVEKHENSKTAGPRRIMPGVGAIR
jgi:hypothetical protein